MRPRRSLRQRKAIQLQSRHLVIPKGQVQKLPNKMLDTKEETPDDPGAKAPKSKEDRTPVVLKPAEGGGAPVVLKPASDPAVQVATEALFGKRVHPQMNMMPWWPSDFKRQLEGLLDSS